MKAPDKIFMPNELLSEEWQLHIEGEDTAYIRKDALLEWAKENNKRINTEEGDYSLGYVSAMIDLIEKIEAL